MRTRDLKPDFWTDERVVGISDAAKLLFQGLWCLADREGRLEDKPVPIGFKVRPWDPQKTGALLNELHAAGLIVRYSVGDAKCIGIPGFKTHQRVHPREMASKLPDWNDNSASREKANPAAPRRETAVNSVSQSGSSGPSGPAGSSGPASSNTPPLAAPKRIPPTAIAPPTTSPADWLAEDFWRWAESKRRTAGCPPQGPPDPRKLSAWWSTARQLVEAPELQEAFLRFGDDPHWQHEKPPLPFAAFMSQWNDFLPLRKRNAS